ncbi:MFS transporter [Helicobacter sp. 23-1044]
MSSKRTIKSLTALFVAMAFLFAGNALIVSSVGVILKQSGASALAIGAVNAFFFFGALVSTISSHKIIAHIGHIRAFGIFGAMCSICIILHSLSVNLMLWAGLRFCLGFAYYGLLVIIESWLNEKSKDAVRSRVIGFYEIVFYVSFGAGILIMGLNLPTHTLFVLSSCLIMFSSLPLNLLRINAPPIPQKTPISLPKVFSVAPLALLGSFIGGMLMNGFFSMGSVFALSRGLSVGEVAHFMFCVMLGGFIAQSLIGSISDRFGRKVAIMLVAFVALVGSVGFLLKLGIWGMCVFGVIFGAGILCLYSLALARANDMLKDKSKSVEVSRTMLFSYSLGSLMSPLVLGALMQGFGVAGFVWFYIANLVFLIAFAANKPR